ncbi:tetratricopeptide repeat-containing sensor histidine kinase [Flavobacterium difficile]|uniref:Signal transduction histidine kinase internal region domain-containing protein n=1 Tax=Flavobacterium difficile TaxID=2709659 RepID=A0ABX0I5J9_9FLAO|nr:tetratricopeptide repeat protein [Flavobacterium difficile]NHM00751.1 hypothetical protein [Flavobacterium difficile]
MKKKYVLFLFFTCFIFSQNKDSLLQVIKNYKLQDTLQCSRLSLYVELENDENIWMKYNTDMYNIAFKKINLRISNELKKKYYYYIGTYFNNIGFYYGSKDNYEFAILYYKKAIWFYKKAGKNNSMANTLSNIGIIFVKKGEPQKYIEYSNKALKLYKETNNYAGVANIYADLGYQYAENGSEEKAIKYLVKSLKISDSIKSKQSKIRSLEHIVKVLKSQNENQKALQYSYELASYFKEIDDKESLALTYFSIASTYNALKDFKNLFTYTSKSIELSKKINSTNTIAANYGLLAKYYLTQKQIENSFKYSKLELDIREKSLKEPAYTKSLLRFVEILIQRKDYQTAEKIGLQAYKKAQLLENTELIMSAAKNLKSIYIAMNKKSNALDFAVIELNMNDSLNAVNTKNSAIKNIFKYETEKREAEIKQLSQAKKISELENKKQKFTVYLLILIIFSVIISSYLLFKRYKINKQNEILKSEIAKTTAERKASESELKALKSQMNPHFIFNALNSIQEQFMFGDKLVANEQMGNFTTLTRQILTISGKKKIPLEVEVDVLTKYLELEKMRFETDFEYAIHVNENIDDQYIELPPMLIQPFVENSIKHGLLHKKGLKKLVIHFDLNANETFLLCTIEDNGIGRKKSEEIKYKNNHKSFSTTSVAQRLQIINDNENINDALVYEDLHDTNRNVIGTRVTLKISLT